MSAFGELSPSTCSLLRTATSISSIAPEIAKLSMRYYRISSSLSEQQHHREKRFLFNKNSSKDITFGSIKTSLLEQMVSNAFKDVNFTALALSILNNDDTMNKLQQNIQADVIIRTAMRNIDYEKLGHSLWTAAESEFNMEHAMKYIINITRINLVHEELLEKGTLPDWFIKSIHPKLNVQVIHQMFEDMKMLAHEFVIIMNSTQNLDDYLFNMIQKEFLISMKKRIQRIIDEKPATLNQLIEIISNDVNQVIMEKLTPTSKLNINKKTRHNTSLSTRIPTNTSEDDNYDDLKLIFYQSSITIDSIGQTMRILFKDIEQIYCTTIWD